MPINDTGYAITVGPDRDGQHFDVPPGDKYTLPTLDQPGPQPRTTRKPKAKPKAATTNDDSEGGETA